MVQQWYKIEASIASARQITTQNMDSPSEYSSKSAQSTAKETDDKSTTRDVHDRLQMDSTDTIDHTDQPETPNNPGSPHAGTEDIPNTPQQNLVQSTMTQGHGSD